MPHLENGHSNVAPNDLTGIMRKSRGIKEIEVFLKIEIASQKPGVIILVIIMNRTPLLEQKKGFGTQRGRESAKTSQGASGSSPAGLITEGTRAHQLRDGPSWS